MLVKENIDTINSMLNKIFDFVKTDQHIQNNLQQYTKLAMGRTTSQTELQSALMAYIFEYELEDNKKVLDFYLDKESKLTSEEKNIISGMNKSIISVFEVKKVTKEGFDLFNIINEKIYDTSVLVRMVNFRGIMSGQYLVCRIFPYKNKYYLIGIDNVIPSSLKENAYRYAVSQQIKKPELLYQDNEKKIAEIEASIHDLGVKYKGYFKQDVVITQNVHADELLSGFNDYIEDGKLDPELNLDELIVPPEKYAYFEVKEMMNNPADPMQAAAQGFSSHEKIYDIGIIFDPDTGLLVLPFYGTFKQIFSVDDYKSISGYKNCISSYIESDRIPPAPILRVYKQNKSKFTKIVQEVLNLENEPDIEELMHKYKSPYLNKKQFSALTVLYLSRAFNELMEITKEKQDKADIKPVTGVRRNDPCPCGSGKKYKKCCLR